MESGPVRKAIAESFRRTALQNLDHLYQLIGMKIYAICLTVLFAAAAGQAGAQVQYSENQAETERLFLDAYQRKIEGKIDEAINIYKEVFKIDERSPVPAYELARIYFAKS